MLHLLVKLLPFVVLLCWARALPNCSGVGPIFGTNWSAGCLLPGENLLFQVTPAGFSSVHLQATYDQPVQFRVTQVSVYKGGCTSVSCNLLVNLDPNAQSELTVVRAVGGSGGTWPLSEPHLDFGAPSGTTPPPELNVDQTDQQGSFFGRSAPYLYEITSGNGVSFGIDVGSASVTVWLIQGSQLLYNRTASVHVGSLNTTAGGFVDLRVIVPLSECTSGCKPSAFSVTPIPFEGDWPGQSFARPNSGKTSTLSSLLVYALVCWYL